MSRTSSLRSAAELSSRPAAAFRAVLSVFALLIVPGIAAAQDTASVGPYARAVATWIALIASPGSEHLATERILSGTSGWTRDRMGNLIKTTGQGSPRRVIACGLDESGYVVSEITEDGYLRVHMSGNERHVALWDQYHEGQRVIVAAVDRASPLKTRNLPGVIAVRSNHLWRHRVADDSPTSIENVWVDVGARSRAEAQRMGIDVLDPVVSDWPEWVYADQVAGPAAGNRAGCEAVAAAGEATNQVSTETDFIISVQKSFGWAGLTSAIARLGRVDSLYIVDDAVGGSRSEAHPIHAPWAPIAGLDVGPVFGIGVHSRFTGTLAESIGESDLIALHRGVAAAAGIGGDTPLPIQLQHGWTAAPPLVIRDSLSRYADLLGKLVDLYAPSGQEENVRDMIQSMLPAWAKDSVQVDTAGNLILAMGPDRDTTVFVAHMDEISFQVTRVNNDGTVVLQPHGSFFPFMWEGQPALLHRPDDRIPPRDGKFGCSASREGPLRGVFTVRDSSTQREPQTIEAWFGRSAADLASEGVQPGAKVTGFKCSARMSEMRLTGRSIDDRAGDAAMLLALDDIDRTKLDHKVIFVWSVREEGGLLGAKAVAATLGPTVRRVHAIDTFVTSDSPLESHRFAYAPLGAGAVLRSLDNSSVTPPDEIDRAIKIAKANLIPLQYGVTNGGNDGSEFARWGAPDVAIAWPLRYSHSPAEVIDLRDLRSLTRLVVALAKTPTGPTPEPPRKRP